MAGRINWLGWAIVFLFLVLYTITAGVVFSFNTLELYIEKNYKSSLALLELLGALPASIQGLVAPLAMWMSFKLGTWQTALIGTALTTLGLILSGVANSLGMLFFTYGGLTAVGILLLLNPPFYLVDQIFPYEHPRHVMATSITACGFPLASLIINPVSNGLAQTVGWHMTYVVMAGFLLVSAIAWIAAAIIWQRRQQYEEQRDAQGLDSNQSEPEGQVENEANTQVESSEEGEQVHISTALKVGIGSLWTVASICKCTAYYTPMLTLLKQMETQGISRSVSWQVMPVIGTSELVSRLIASWAGDYYKRSALFMYAGACFSLAIANILGSFATTREHFMMYGAGLGIFGGPIIASLYSCSAEVLYGQYVPLVFSLFRIGIGTACLIGPIIAGGIHDQLGTMKPIFYLYASLYFISTIIYIIIILANRYHRPGSNKDRSNLLQNEPISYQTLHNECTDE